jgi:biopolymer transport protein ExbD
MSQPSSRFQVPLGDDSALNMTPMIDICFQLIVFFMLTLKFPSVSARFECQLPKHVGPQDQPVVIPPFQDVQVKLFREHLERPPAEQFTRIRVGESFTVTLPKGPWPQGGELEAARRREEERVMARVTQAVAAAWTLQGRSPEVGGQIRTPFPKGVAVPHGDVMLAFDAIVAAGITNVHLEGAAPPLPGKAGGGWKFD